MSVKNYVPVGSKVFGFLVHWFHITLKFTSVKHAPQSADSRAWKAQLKSAVQDNEKDNGNVSSWFESRVPVLNSETCAGKSVLGRVIASNSRLLSNLFSWWDHTRFTERFYEARAVLSKLPTTGAHDFQQHKTITFERFNSPDISNWQNMRGDDQVVQCIHGNLPTMPHWWSWSSLSANGR